MLDERKFTVSDFLSTAKAGSFQLFLPVMLQPSGPFCWKHGHGVPAFRAGFTPVSPFGASPHPTPLFKAWAKACHLSQHWL